MINQKLLTLYLGIFLLCSGITIFYIGFHNIDICSNLIYINCKYDLKLVETNYLDKIINPIRCYKDGLITIEIGLITSIIGAFISGRNIKWNKKIL